MNLTIVSAFRDSDAGLAAYIQRVTTLDWPYNALRIVCVEGDSVDHTWQTLQAWQRGDERVTLVKCDTGKPRYGSIVHPERFEILATVFNAGLNAVDLEWSDWVMFLPSDIRYMHDLARRLIERDKDLIAPLTWFRHGETEHHYDIWANGFPNFTREWAAANLVAEPFEHDFIGGTMLMRAEVIRSGCRYTVEDVDRGLCAQARAMGYRCWIAPDISVHHPSLWGT